MGELLPFSCYSYKIFPGSNGTKPPFVLMFGHETVEGRLTHLYKCSRYYREKKDKIILEELHKLWKHCATYLRDKHNRKDDCTPSKPTSNAKFEIGQAVVVRNHACQTLSLNT